MAKKDKKKPQSPDEESGNTTSDPEDPFNRHLPLNPKEAKKKAEKEAKAAKEREKEAKAAKEREKEAKKLADKEAKTVKERDKEAKKLAEKQAKEADKEAKKKKKADKLIKKVSSLAAAERTPEEIEAGRKNSLELAVLKKDEKQFFKKVEAGDVEEVKKFLNEHRDLNVNCVNFCGVSALHVAIEKQNMEMVKFLFEIDDLLTRDAALHAVATGDVDFATAVLDIINDMYGLDVEMGGCEGSPDYPPDITPMAVAAHNGDYKMVRMLKERKHELKRPHSPDCLCKECRVQIRQFGSSAPRIRLGRYKAISNPAFIAHQTDDPILYCFEVDKEMQDCAEMDNEFKDKYEELRKETRDFPVQILSQCRDTKEVEKMLKIPFGFKDKAEFPRLQLALDFKQKEFVAHSLVQQVLTAHWLGEFRSWPRLSFWRKALHILFRMIFFPFFCIFLMCSTENMVKKIRSPLNRFLLELASYFFFLLSVFLLNYLATGEYHKGPPKTGCEGAVVLFVIGHIWATLRQMFREGPRRFIDAYWNWYDLLTELLFLLTFAFWFVSWLDVLADKEHKRKELDRKFWKSTDPTLIHEALFALASILAYGKLAYYCLLSSRFGPLQVSIGKMIYTIIQFLVLSLVINAAFANTLSRMYAYYDGMKRIEENGDKTKSPDAFSTFRTACLTLFWTMLGNGDTDSADVVVENLNDDPKAPLLNYHVVTEWAGWVLFASFNVIMIIALVNTLIAILSNTFTEVLEHADVEFKFARARLWTRFFDSSTAIPPPLNWIPTYNCLSKTNAFCKATGKKSKGGVRKCSFWRCCYVEYAEEDKVDIREYEELIKILVQRYYRSKQVIGDDD